MNKLEEKRPEEFNRLNEYLTNLLFVEAEELVNEADIEFDLGCDDLDKVEIIIEAEAIFECGISDDEFDKVSKLGDLYECILNCL